MSQLTFGSLFAGIGGFDLGFERAGMRCEWQVELDERRRLVLAKHWPLVPRFGDIRTISILPPVDVICGGFPCKNTSTAAAIHRRRHGLSGAASKLWYEMLRIVRHNRPRTVIVENVAGAASWTGQIKGGLEDAGYYVPDVPLCVPAEAVGAPHCRARLFWLADTDRKRLAFARQGGPSALNGTKGRATDGNYWLQTIGRAMRMDDGLSAGLDRRERIESLGDSVVPQVAEWIGRRIVEAT